MSWLLISNRIWQASHATGDHDSGVVGLSSDVISFSAAKSACEKGGQWQHQCDQVQCSHVLQLASGMGTGSECFR
eukprot:8460358-Karenia_brevis.AAC.1